ncbi:MAG: hypothetical protein RI907_2399 [Pseudomonadota bacterium]|jgi:microcystin-dependent protein
MTLSSTRARIALHAGIAACALLSAPAHATCTAEPYIGSVCYTAANFCPQGYLPADGRELSIYQYQAVYALLGTTYGGNGVQSFALPDLRGRVAVGTGQRPGALAVTLGQTGGQTQVNIQVNQMPAHTHTAQLKGTAAAGNSDSPAGAVPAKLARSSNFSTGAATDNMSSSAIAMGSAGGGQPLDIRNPYLGMTACIAVTGLFPSRP